MCGISVNLILAMSLVYFVSADLDVCLEEVGCMRGTTMPGYQKGSFEAFLGIPYAQPPIGELRFKNPVAASPWSDVLDASAPRNTCLQKCFFMDSWPVSGEEDCLYLNVYRPLEHSESPLPVMVYIHAGGLQCGSGHPLVSGPEFLMDTQEVILVTVNYRLGPFGFLSTGDAHMSGNFGLKDQRLALQWVQQHIAAFGGNPELVTLFGHSAGGMSTHYHMLSPNSKGLFHRAASLSGVAFAMLMLVWDPLTRAQKLAEHVGVADAETLNTLELTEALRKVDALTLVEAGTVHKIWDNLPITNYGFVIEQEATPESFFTECPLKAHLSGKIHDVPWVLGSTSRAGEGSLFLLHTFENPELLQEFNGNFLQILSLLLSLPQDETASETVKDILKLYDVQEMELNKATLEPLSGLIGDFVFKYPLYVSAESYVKYAKQPLSIYNFEYLSLSNISYAGLLTKGVIHEELGASHMDDALHTIRMPLVLSDFPKDSEDDIVTERMTDLLIEFAKTGVFYDHNELPACKAEDFSPETFCNFLQFGQAHGVYKETIETQIDMRGLSLWKKLYL